ARRAAARRLLPAARATSSASHRPRRVGSPGSPVHSERYGYMSRLPLLLLLTGSLATACVQNVDPNAASGKMEGGGTVPPGAPPMPMGGPTGGGPPAPTAGPDAAADPSRPLTCDDVNS